MTGTNPKLKNRYFVKTISKRIIASVLLTMMLGISNAAVLPVFAEDSKIPDWVRNISKWWSDGKITKKLQQLYPMNTL